MSSHRLVISKGERAGEELQIPQTGIDIAPQASCEPGGVYRIERENDQAYMLYYLDGQWTRVAPLEDGDLFLCRNFEFTYRCHEGPLQRPPHDRPKDYTNYDYYFVRRGNPDFSPRTPSN
jgi:hypothetical protein